MNDRGERRNWIPWVIGALLVALMVFFALRGSFEQIDRDGGSNADAGTPNAGSTPNRSSTDAGTAQ
jgi:preprotein translocase subunit SecF